MVYVSDNWGVQNLQNTLDTWNEKLEEIWQLITQSPEQFKGGTIWSVIVDIHGAVQAIMQGLISTIMNAAGFGSASETVLPQEIVDAIEDCGFFESIPLWAVTLIGGLFLTVLWFIIIMSVYGRFFRLYLYTAIASVPLSTFAGEPSQNVGKSFIKAYAAVCLEGAIIVLGCIIFSLFAASPPAVDPDAAAVSMVWSYIGKLIFNMLVLVGAVKMADRVVREMMGL